jgi:putative flippase GtrA
MIFYGREGIPAFDTILQLIRFCIVGAVNTLVTFITYYLLVRLNLNMSVSYAAAYLGGLATSLLLNSRWTFAVPELRWQMIIKFILTNILVLSVGEWLLRPVVYRLHVQIAFAQAVTLLPTTLLNFLFCRYWVFKTDARTLSVEERE